MTGNMDIFGKMLEILQKNRAWPCKQVLLGLVGVIEAGIAQNAESFFEHNGEVANGRHLSCMPGAH